MIPAHLSVCQSKISLRAEGRPCRVGFIPRSVRLEDGPYMALRSRGAGYCRALDPALPQEINIGQRHAVADSAAADERPVGRVLIRKRRVIDCLFLLGRTDGQVVKKRPRFLHFRHPGTHFLCI